MEKNEHSVDFMTKYLPATVKAETLAKLDETAKDFRALCAINDLSPVTALKRAAVMQHLRDILTPDIMAPLMALQGNVLGFKTDKDTMKEKGERVKGPGYPEAVVRDVFIYSAGKGAQMINNEVNILASNPYLTKNFFFRKLDEVLGRENWRITHDIPTVIQANGRVGAKVRSRVWWRDSKTGQEGATQELEYAIKGDEYASADAYTGKADRKAANWLLSNITGERFAEGEADDAIDIRADVISAPKKSLFEPAPEKPAAPAPAKPKTLKEALKCAPVTEEDIKAYYKAKGQAFDEGRVLENLTTIVNNVLDFLDSKKSAKQEDKLI